MWRTPTEAPDAVAGLGVAPLPRVMQDPGQALAGVRAQPHEHLGAGVLAPPPDPELRGELEAHSWAVDSAGRIAIIAKDEIRRRLRRSPDRADGVAMAVAAAHDSAAGVWGTIPCVVDRFRVTW